jgi:hypothetical protein
MDEERIKIWTENSRTGISILKADYDFIAHFILLLIEREGEICLHELIDKAQTELASYFCKDISWYLIQVKRDLMEKGVLRITLQRDRTQLIRLRKHRLSSKKSLSNYSSNFTFR